jgi:hypothetical protein
MSNVHIRQVEDEHGDLVDLEYYHHSCAPAEVLGWPAPGEVDYPVFCAKCERRVYEVPLTSWGQQQFNQSLQEG